MSWPCEFLGEHDDYLAYVAKNGTRAGLMWYSRWRIEGEYAKFQLENFLSKAYVNERMAKRPPIDILYPYKLTTGAIAFGEFCIDSCFQPRVNDGDGWTVTGEPPKISMVASINIVGIFHGSLTNGVLSQC
jgi:hypothetical protein